jgi:hypothetical protein
MCACAISADCAACRGNFEIAKQHTNAKWTGHSGAQPWELGCDRVTLHYENCWDHFVHATLSHIWSCGTCPEISMQEPAGCVEQVQCHTCTLNGMKAWIGVHACSYVQPTSTSIPHHISHTRVNIIIACCSNLFPSLLTSLGWEQCMSHSYYLCTSLQRAAHFLT